MSAAAEKKKENGAAPSAIALVKRDVIDVVAARVQELVSNGQLELPENYAVGSALMSWWLALQVAETKDREPVLQACTRESIANATLEMVVLGLTPAKKQCYPIAYGATLCCQRSYFGDEAVLRRVRPDVAHVWAEIIYKSDTIKWRIRGGRRTVEEHIQDEANVGGLDKIAGCYVVIEDVDGEVLDCTRMTIAEIKTSWKKSKTYGKGDTFHTEQPDQACKRTVIRRAAKRLVNSSDDSYLKRAIERSELSAAEAEMSDEIEQHANRELIDFPEARSLPAEQARIEEATVEREKATAKSNSDPGF
jgi:recombination protein RecT